MNSRFDDDAQRTGHVQGQVQGGGVARAVNGFVEAPVGGGQELVHQVGIGGMEELSGGADLFRLGDLDLADLGHGDVAGATVLGPAGNHGGDDAAAGDEHLIAGLDVCHLGNAVTDGQRLQEGTDVIGDVLRHGQAIVFFHQHIFRITTVGADTGTATALGAGVHDDPVPLLQSGAFAGVFYHTAQLVAEDAPDVGRVLAHLQVAAADTAGSHLQQHFIVFHQGGAFDFLYFKGGYVFQHTGLHHIDSSFFL